MANISIVGATGIVGKELLKLLEKSCFISKVCLYSSKNSEGKIVTFRKKLLKVQTLHSESFLDDDLIFFCTPSHISQYYMPIAMESRAKIIDLSSAYREDPHIPLVIPEINKEKIIDAKLISSPNCVVSILLMAIYPLHLLFHLKRIVGSTYQAASGGGYSLMQTLLDDTKNFFDQKNKRKNSAFNTYLHNSQNFSDGYNFEEKKIIWEIQKILQNQSLEISITSVRVPSLRAHCVSCHLTFKKKVDVKAAEKAIRQSKGIKWISDPCHVTCNDVDEKKEIHCTRIRKVPFSDHILELWVAGDQLLKGAALNALQIAQIILESKQSTTGKT